MYVCVYIVYKMLLRVLFSFFPNAVSHSPEIFEFLIEHFLIFSGKTTDTRNGSKFL